MFTWLAHQDRETRNILGLLTLALLLAPIILVLKVVSFFADFLFMRDLWPFAIAGILTWMLAVLCGDKKRRRVLGMFGLLIFLPLAISFIDFTRTGMGLADLEATLGRTLTDAERRSLFIHGKAFEREVRFWHAVNREFLALSHGRSFKRARDYHEADARLKAKIIDHHLFLNGLNEHGESLQYAACESLLRLTYLAEMRRLHASYGEMDAVELRCDSYQCPIDIDQRHETGYGKAVGIMMQQMKESGDAGAHFEACYEVVVNGTTKRL